MAWRPLADDCECTCPGCEGCESLPTNWEVEFEYTGTGPTIDILPDVSEDCIFCYIEPLGAEHGKLWCKACDDETDYLIWEIERVGDGSLVSGTIALTVTTTMDGDFVWNSDDWLCGDEAWRFTNHWYNWTGDPEECGECDVHTTDLGVGAFITASCRKRRLDGIDYHVRVEVVLGAGCSTFTQEDNCDPPGQGLISPCNELYENRTIIGYYLWTAFDCNGPCTASLVHTVILGAGPPLDGTLPETLTFQPV